MAVATVGMIGAGQLARMTAQAAIPLGIRFRVLAEHPDDSAALVCPDVELGSPQDLDALQRFSAACDVVTFDHELVPPPLLQALAAGGAILRPSPSAKAFAQDKLHQRTNLAALGLPVPPFAAVATLAEVEAFARDHGWPVVLKASRGGYDGRGVWLARDAGEVAAALAEAQRSGAPVIAEAFVPIERELAAMVARRPSGEMVTYPVVETVQVEGMCRELIAPAPVPPQVAGRAAGLAREVVEAIGATGIVALELFLARDGQLLVNELALRPHNSGHYSIEGCTTSQFESHLRAVLDWPLGETALTAHAVVTVNVVGAAAGGDPRELLPRALAVPGVHVHLYGKGPRPGRKLGHVTALGDDVAEVRARANRAAALLTASPTEVTA
jgi:5-(carboxyamino)imidazole ribonucleotide synthase